MKPSVWEKLDLFARNLTPFGLTLLVVLLNVVPFHVPALAMVVPVLPLMAVFHWAIYRPELLPLSAVFFVGVLQDVLTQMPLGVNAFVFTGVYWAVLTQRRFLFGKSFAIVWLGFALVAFVAQLATWLLVTLLNAAIVPTGAMMHQYLLTLGCFPVLAWTLLRWQQKIMRQE